MHTAVVRYTRSFDVCVCLSWGWGKDSQSQFVSFFFQAWFMVEMTLEMKCDAGAWVTVRTHPIYLCSLCVQKHFLTTLCFHLGAASLIILWGVGSSFWQETFIHAISLSSPFTEILRSCSQLVVWEWRLTNIVYTNRYAEPLLFKWFWNLSLCNIGLEIGVISSEHSALPS